ncbi:MAG: F0F1 ATP synthase subunit A [Planctomycetota bacterium]
MNVDMMKNLTASIFESPPSLLGEDLISHVLPHNLHSQPLFSIPVGDDSLNIAPLGIENGQIDFYITNYLMMTVASALLVIIGGFFAASQIRKARNAERAGEGLKHRGTFAKLFETICTFVRDEMVRPNLGEATDKYIGYIWTIFFFILTANVLGLIPFGPALSFLTSADPSVSTYLAHFGGTATSTLSLNIILALGTLLAIIIIGIRETSVKDFFNHFNPVGWEPAMLPISIPLYGLELLSLLIKTAVLAMRLFGTMMAGHLVLAAFVMMIGMALEFNAGMGIVVFIMVVLLCTALMLLELFVCMLQAFVFTFLTILFISMFAHHEHDHDHDLHDEHAMSDESQMDPDKLLDAGRLGVMP